MKISQHGPIRYTSISTTFNMSNLTLHTCMCDAGPIPVMAITTHVKQIVEAKSLNSKVGGPEYLIPWSQESNSIQVGWTKRLTHHPYWAKDYRGYLRSGH